MVAPPSDRNTKGSGRGGLVLMAAFLVTLGAVGWWIASSRPIDTPPDPGTTEEGDRTANVTSDTLVQELPSAELSYGADRVQDVAPTFLVEVFAPNRGAPASPAPGARVAWLPREAPPKGASPPTHTPTRHELERRALQHGGIATTDAEGHAHLALPDDDIEIFAWTIDAFASRTISASFRRSLTRLRLELMYDVALDVLVLTETGHGAGSVDVLVGREVAARTDGAGRARIERIRSFAPHPKSSVQVSTLRLDYPGAVAGVEPGKLIDPWQQPQMMRTLKLPSTGSIEIAVYGDVPWTRAQLHAIDDKPGFLRMFEFPRTGNDLSVIVPHVALGRRYAIQVDLAPSFGGTRRMTVDGPKTSGERVFVVLQASEAVRVVGSVLLGPSPPLPLNGQLEFEIVGATHRGSDPGRAGERIGSVRTNVRAHSTFEFVLPPFTVPTQRTTQRRHQIRLTYISETRGVSHEGVGLFPLNPDAKTIDLGQVKMNATESLIEGVVVTAHGVTAEVHAQRLFGGVPHGLALENVPVDSEGRFRVRMPSSMPSRHFGTSSVEVRATAPFHMPAVRVVEAGQSVRIELARAATLVTTTFLPLAFGANMHADDLRIELTPLLGTDRIEHGDPKALVARAVDLVDAGEFFLVLHRFDAVPAGRYRVAHRVSCLGEVHVLEDLPVIVRETCEPTWLTFDLRDHVRMLNVVVRDPDGERSKAGGHLEVRCGEEIGMFPLHEGFAAIPFGEKPIEVKACVDGFAPVTSVDVKDDLVVRLGEQKACVLRIAAVRPEENPMQLVVVSLHGSTPERDSSPAFEVSVKWPTTRPVDIPMPRAGRYRLVARRDFGAFGGLSEREIDVVRVDAEPRTVRVHNPWTMAVRRER